MVGLEGDLRSLWAGGPAGLEELLLRRLGSLLVSTRFSSVSPSGRPMHSTCWWGVWGTRGDTAPGLVSAGSGVGTGGSTDRCQVPQRGFLRERRFSLLRAMSACLDSRWMPSVPLSIWKAPLQYKFAKACPLSS